MASPLDGSNGLDLEVVEKTCSTNGAAEEGEKKDGSAAGPSPEQFNAHRTVRSLKIAVPIKNVVSLYLLGPGVVGECNPDRHCMAWVNGLLLALDFIVFSAHLFLAMRRPAYQEKVLTYNFYILLIFWSIWNLGSHPLCRHHVIDLFVAPPEIHVLINVAAIAMCSSSVLAPPSMRHLIGLVTWEFLISLVLSSIEVMNFSVDSGWLAVVRLDVVMFNIAILLIGSTILLGTMTVEKDIKELAYEMEKHLVPSDSFDDDLEKRKRAVLTALCDVVFTMDSSYTILGSNEKVDRIFQRSMENEPLTSYFKDDKEKERFLESVRKQFPEDGSAGEGPKRMRIAFRDEADPNHFEADLVVSDAHTDSDGRVSKYMVGMHIRGEFRNRTLEGKKGNEGPLALTNGKSRLDSDGRGADRRKHAVAGGSVSDARLRPKGSNGTLRDAANGDKDNQKADGNSNGGNSSLTYEEFNRELMCTLEGMLKPPSGASNHDRNGDEHAQQRFTLRRASNEAAPGTGDSEALRRRALPAASDGLRRLMLPEPAGPV